MEIKWKDVMAELKALRTDVHALKLEMTQYRGFVRGVLWTFSAIGAVAGFCGGLVFAH